MRVVALLSVGPAYVEDEPVLAVDRLSNVVLAIVVEVALLLVRELAVLLGTQEVGGIKPHLNNVKGTVYLYHQNFDFTYIYIYIK